MHRSTFLDEFMLSLVQLYAGALCVPELWSLIKV